MKPLNIILSLISLNVLLVTIERFSFTTKIFLQPYNFLRLHEVVQMSFLILVTVILPFLLLKELSKNFELLKSTKGTILGLFFLTGVYFYSTGNGVHETSSYLFNTFCNINKIRSLICEGMFFNDYYFGNILYFLGAIMFTIPLIIFERINPNKTYRKNDFIILFINSFFYALAIFAYAAFDLVLIGLIYSITTTIIIFSLLFTNKTKYRYFPFTLYSGTAYLLGSFFSLILRLH